MELPGMAADQLLIDESNIRDEHWEPPVRNLDRFFTSMYQYYVAKGLPAVILQQISGVVTLGFTIAVSIFLIAFVDWTNLKHCKDESSCNKNFLIEQPFANSSITFALTIVIYGLLFGAFWVWKVMSAIHVISSAITVERFYREKLGLRLSDLNEMQWHEVLQRLILLHEHGIHRVAIQDKLTEHDVVLRIMRKDNYMIGLINKKLLDLRVPWWISPIISERLFLTKSLEWSLSFCILEYMFNEEFVISSSFLKNVPLLQTRLRVVGAVHMLLLPFMVIFMSIHFFLQNAQSFHSSKSYLGPRQWSPLALWSFREFNELPHIFNDRINKSYEPSNEYIQSFSNPYTAIIASFIAYIGGAVLASLLLISFFSEGVLLYVSFLDHNLLWYLGIFSAIYAGARSLIPDKTKKIEGPTELLGMISSCTHYFPPHWINRCHTTLVKDEMSELFPFKVHLFGMELLSVLLTPIVLCFSLPTSAQTIVDFVRDHSKYVDGVGAVCDFSLFDFDLNGDDQHGAAAKGSMEESHRPLNGKMEKSFINFQQVHPNWRIGSGGGEALLEKVHGYRDMKQHQRDLKIASALQDSMRFHLGGENQNLLFSKIDDINKQTRVIDTPLGLSDSGHEISSETANAGIDHNQSDIPVILKGAVSSLLNDSPRRVPPSGPGGVWGPYGYSRASNENTDQDANLRNPNVTRRSNSMFPQIDDDIALSYYKSAPSVHNRVGAASMNLFGERSVSFSPDRVNNRQDMPSILRSILKQENIDYQNDFYWMNRFQEDKMKDPANFENSLSQSMSLLGKQPTFRTSQLPGGSAMFDGDMNSFNLYSPSRSGRVFRSDVPPTTKGPARGPKGVKRIVDRGDHSGFCFTLPEGTGGMGNSLGPGFESSILGGSMMRREGGYSQMGTGTGIIDESMGGDRAKDHLSNQYTVLPQSQQHQQHQQQQQQQQRKQP